jgi:2-hydroxychromene-2-carboxylate isomerase
MSRHIDYYLSLNSPWAYLGSQRLEQIALRHRVEVRVKPVDFGTIFPQTGGLPLPKRAPARQAYRLTELARWQSLLEMPLNLHPRYFGAPELAAACAVIAAGESGGDPLALAHAVLRAVWAEERNIADAGTLSALAGETGHHGLHVMARAYDPQTRASYRALTAEALAAGVFGAPSYIFEGELFWGQDRLDFLDRALAAV